MPRIARVVIPGCPHHVTQRGNDRQAVFFTDQDRRYYLELLARHSGQFGLAVLGYCLMDNHVHLVVVPQRQDSLARALGRTHFRYAQAIHRLHGRSGHFWQNRFYSCALDDEHFWTAMAYVERNPVRARLVRLAWRYPWSSAAAHVEMTDASGLLDMETWARMLPRGDWREALRKAQDQGLVDGIRRNTHTGRPLGSDRFLSRLEAALRRRLRPLAGGRPKKNNARGKKTTW